MDATEKLQCFLKYMDNNGKMPTERELKSVCNPKTEFIWEQFLDNVRRREKIHQIRGNHLIAEINKSKKNHGGQTEIKNLSLWNKREELKKSVDIKKNMLLEEKKELQNVSQRISIKEVKLKNLQEECKEKEIKHHMMELKCNQLNVEAEECKELIKKIKTPEELDFCEDNTKVLNNLKKCMEKLSDIQQKEFSKNDSSSSNFCSFPSNDNSMRPPVCSTVRKSVKKPLFKHENSYRCLGTPLQPQNSFVSQASTDVNVEIRNFQKNGASKTLLNDLRQENDRGLVWKHLQTVCDGVKTEYLSKMEKCGSIDTIGDPTETKEYKEHLAKLYAIDIRNKLETLKHQKKQRKLNKSMNNSNSMETKGAVDILEEEIALLQNVKTCDQELNGIIQESGEIEDKIANISNNIIDRKMEIIKRVYESLHYKRKQRFPLVKSLQRYSEDSSDWAAPLMIRYASDEVALFIEFPLNYYATLNGGKSQTSTYFPGHETLDNFTKYMLAVIVQPQQSLERTMVNLIQRKMYLAALKSWGDVQQSEEIAKITCEELQKNEAHVKSSIQSINRISNKTHTVTKEHVKSLTNIWLEMPFKNCLLPTRTYNGQTLKYYENAFAELYKQISDEKV